MKLKKIFIGVLLGFGVMVNGLYALTIDSDTTLTGVYDDNITINSGIVVINDATITGKVYINGGTVYIFGDNQIIGITENNSNHLTITGGIVNVPGSITLDKLIAHTGGTLVLTSGGSVICEYYYAAGGANAILRMLSNSYMKVNSNFSMSDYTLTTDLTGGTLEITGSLQQQQGSNSFNSSGTHKVILAGDRHQYVRLDHSDSSLNILEINNTSSDGVTFITDINSLNNLITTTHKINNLNLVSPNLNLQNDITIDGNVMFSSGYLNLGDNNITINGDFNVSATILELNTSDVNVTGDFNFSGWNGTLAIDSGALTVGKNLTIGNTPSSTENLYFKMLEENGYVLVGSDFIMRTDINNYNGLSAGLLEIKGDFIHSGGAMETSFAASGTHKVLLSGDTKQFVTFNTFEGRSHFNVLEVNNTSSEGVEFNSTVTIGKNLITTTSKINNLHLVRSSFTLLNDITIDGNVSFSDYSLINFGDKTITINGDFNLSSSLDLNMSTFNIGGNFNYYGTLTSILRVDNANVTVDNNFTLGNSLNSDDNIYFNMVEENGYVLVGGDFLIATDKDNYSGLSAGTLEIKGDFTHITSYDGRSSFAAKGTHTVVLSGDLQQLVNFGSTNSNFYNLNIINTSAEGVEFQTLTMVTGTLSATNCSTGINLDNIDITYGTLNLDGSCTPLSLLIPDTTQYLLNDSGVIGERTYNTNGTYTGSITSTDGTTSPVSGTYDIVGDVLTLSRTSPSVSTLVFTYQGEDAAGVMTFDLSIDGGAVSQSYSYDTADARDTSDMDVDGFTDLEEYQAGTDATDASDNSFTVAIMNKTTYFFNSTGTIGDRNYVDDGTYTGNLLLTSGAVLVVEGTYEITGKTLTLTRVSPSALTLVFTYLSTDAGVTNFDQSINEGDVTQSYLYDTEQERDEAIPSSAGVNPALIMYLLN